MPPERYPEIAALVGETSDNLPGVPGVGVGFAAKWINQYDGLDNVIAHADEITGKKGEALREHLGDVIRNRRLNALVCDLDLEVLPGDMRLREWDRPAAMALLDELEFRGELRTRIMDVLAPEAEPEVEGGFELDGTILAPDTVAAWLEELGTERVGVHVRGTWGSGTGRVLGIALRARRRPDGLPRRRGDEPGRRRGARRVARRPEATQGAARRQGPDAGAGRPRLDARRRRRGHRARRPTSSAPTSAPTTWPT